MLKAYKYRIYPNKEQSNLIEQSFGCSRFIYNSMLAERKQYYEEHKDDENLQLLWAHKYKTEKDIQELTIHLPSIGNSISKMWDMIYGDGEGEADENGGLKRNDNIAWDNIAGLRLVSAKRDGNGFEYNPDQVNTLAGCRLNIKNPITAPITMLPNKEASGTAFICAITVKHVIIIAETLDDNPSIPSVKFTAFVVASITKIAKGI